MRFSIDKKTVQIPQNLRSISPMNSIVFFEPNERKFYHRLNGVTSQYWDADLGLLNYNGRTFVKTNCTSFIREGNEYTVYLPSEGKFITRPAFSTDEHFKEVEIAEIGRFGLCYTKELELFGRCERVTVSQDLWGEEIYTRGNGEIFRIENEEPKPYFIDQRHFDEEFVRIDLEVTAKNKPKLLTLFYRLKATSGALAWRAHFTDTQSIAKRMHAAAAPFIRSHNCIFHAGEKDLEKCVKILQNTVSNINSSFTSRLGNTKDGKLSMPTVENISFKLLNELHFEFEDFGERFKKGNNDEKKQIMGVYGPFCQLNDQIHSCEGAVSNRGRSLDEAWWALHASFLPDFYTALPDETYQEFTLDWTFGELYMGYHTLGKDIVAAFWNQDVDLFRRNEIRPQKISSAEIFAFFGPDSRGQMEGLRKWWQENDIDQYGFDIDSPNNSIGYIPVANLIRNDLTEHQIKLLLKNSSKLVSVELVTQ